MQIGNLNIPGPLFLAPLAGISNRPFRLIARRCGADMAYTEMVSADGIAMGQEKSLSYLDFDAEEHPVGVQIFGANPENIRKAAAVISQSGADLIDINLGCPVKKVVGKNGGAALLKDRQLTHEIMNAAVEASSLPVTVKMRTGWDNQNDHYLEIGELAQASGIAAVALHARSRAAGFSGKSDWSKIAILKNALKIPVIGNGDINSAEDAARMLAETGCDAIMVGRAAMRNPYIFGAIKAFLRDRTISPEPAISDKIALSLDHAALIIAQFGERSGALMMRKHLAWYTKGFPAGAALRARLMTVTSLDDIRRAFQEFLQSSHPVLNG
ncbi:MAG: tRNA dihydrouridine synthase DusB [Candidatus Zixiibacteriota bacterium]